MTISIDATGLKLRSPVNLEQRNCLFLYIICVHGLEKAYPVAQMISGIHTMDWIQYWLSHWWRVNRTPFEIVMDESSALIGAAVKTFTSYKSTNDYIDACFGAILESKKLKCVYIRIDRSHFVKSIIRNVRCESKIKGSFVRGVLRYLISCENFQQIEHVIKALFTLIRHKYLTPACQTARNYLKELIKTHDFTFMDTTAKEECVNIATDERNEDKEIVKSYKDTRGFDWVLKLYESVDIENETDNCYDESLFYAPELKRYLLFTLSRITLWSNLMNVTFDSKKTCATSFASENEFKNIKQLLNINTVRPDVFVSKYIEFLDGHIKLGLGAQLTNMAKNEAKKRRETDDDYSDYADETASELNSHKNRGKRLTKRIKSTITDQLESNSEIESSCFLEKKLRNDKMEIYTDKNTLMPGSDAEPSVKMKSHKRKHGSESELSEDKSQPSENWGGLNKRSRTPISVPERRAKNSILNPHDVEYFYHQIPQLGNGDEGKNISTSSTCAFDSITSICAVIYADYKYFGNSFTGLTANNPFIEFVVNLFKKQSKKQTDSYKERNELLESLYSIPYYKKSITKFMDGTCVVDCFTGIGPFFQQLTIHGNQDLASAIFSDNCSKCEYKREYARAHFSTLGNKNLGDMLTYLHTSEIVDCPKCKKK